MVRGRGVRITVQELHGLMGGIFHNAPHDPHGMRGREAISSWAGTHILDGSAQVVVAWSVVALGEGSQLRYRQEVDVLHVLEQCL